MIFRKECTQLWIHLSQLGRIAKQLVEPLIKQARRKNIKQVKQLVERRSLVVEVGIGWVECINIEVAHKSRGLTKVERR